jgi:recombination protein RecR
MQILPKSVMKTIEEFSKLPGIGPKTASRLTFYLLNQSDKEVENFGLILKELKTSLTKCKNCFIISEGDICPICRDESRHKNLVMVVSEPLDIIALERTGYKGYYHVLGGVISPIDGIGPEDLTIKELIDKITGDSEIKEVIIATNPSLEGEATALYINRIIDQEKVKGQIEKNILISRIARGLPVGGDVEYADEITLTRALEGRKTI